MCVLLWFDNSEIYTVFNQYSTQYRSKLPAVFGC